MQRFGVQAREAATLLLGEQRAAVCPVRTPTETLKMLRGSPRFHDLVTQMEQNRQLRACGPSEREHVAAEILHREEGVRRAFGCLVQHVGAQQRGVNQLMRALSAWRRRKLFQHLIHWHCCVVEGAFDALAAAVDTWKRAVAAGAKKRVLEDSAFVLQQTVQLRHLERCVNWWSFLTDIERDARLRVLAAALRALHVGIRESAWAHDAKHCASLVRARRVFATGFQAWCARVMGCRRDRATALCILGRVVAAGGVFWVRLAFSAWHCAAIAARLKQRHEGTRRTRVYSVCWESWRRSWMHAKAATHVVWRRCLTTQHQTLVGAVRRWRVGSALRQWLRRRSVLNRRISLRAGLGSLRHWAEVAVWKRQALEAARDLFWTRGHPRMLRSCLAGMRRLLLRLRRARATAMALEAQRKPLRARALVVTVLARWAACTDVLRAVARLRQRVAISAAARVLSRRLLVWRRNAVFAAQWGRLRLRVGRRVCAIGWNWWWTHWHTRKIEQQRRAAQVRALVQVEEAKEEMVGLCRARAELRMRGRCQRALRVWCVISAASAAMRVKAGEMASATGDAGKRREGGERAGLTSDAAEAEEEHKKLAGSKGETRQQEPKTSTKREEEPTEHLDFGVADDRRGQGNGVKRQLQLLITLPDGEREPKRDVVKREAESAGLPIVCTKVGRLHRSSGVDMQEKDKIAKEGRETEDEEGLGASEARFGHSLRSALEAVRQGRRAAGKRCAGKREAMRDSDSLPSPERCSVQNSPAASAAQLGLEMAWSREDALCCADLEEALMSRPLAAQEGLAKSYSRPIVSPNGQEKGEQDDVTRGSASPVAISPKSLPLRTGHQEVCKEFSRESVEVKH